MSKVNYTITIVFHWDDGDERKQFVIALPSDISLHCVKKELQNAHDYLCNEDPDDRYGIDGRCSETLLNYVCEKKGWQWKPFSPDAVFEFE